MVWIMASETTSGTGRGLVTQERLRDFPSQDGSTLRIISSYPVFPEDPPLSGHTDPRLGVGDLSLALRLDLAERSSVSIAERDRFRPTARAVILLVVRE